MTSMFVPDAGHLRRDQGEGLRRRDQHVQGAQPLHEGGPDVQVLGRSRVERDDHRRHGRAPPRRLHRAHEARVQGRGRHRRRRRSRTARRSAQKAEFNYTHKKQTGGSGQYGRVAGYVEPFDGDFEFVDEIKGGSIPREFISSVEKGFKSMIAKSAAPRRAGASASASSINDGRVARGRLERHRVPGSRPRRVPRLLPAREARRSSSRS